MLVGVQAAFRVPAALCLGRTYPTPQAELMIMQSEEQDENGKPYEVINGIADIAIRGEIFKAGLNSNWFADPIIKGRIITAAASDPAVKAIMLRVDSPGGSVDGVNQLADAIAAAKQTKPVMAQVEGMAASAAYWAASQASAIYADEGSMVGSIGAYSLLVDDSEYWKAQGIKWTLVSTGEYKAIGEAGQPITDNQLAEVTHIVNTFFNMFKTAVQRGRGMDKKAVDAVADGKMYIGKQGVEMGLIDKVQNTDQTFAALAKRFARGRAAQAIAAQMEIT